MSAADTELLHKAEAGGKPPGLAFMRAVSVKALDWSVAFWIFTGGMVLFEPSPYELSFGLVLVAGLLAGFGLHRSMLGLLVVFVGFTPFALIAAFQVRHSTVNDALIFVMVTIFLLLTSYFVANYVADAPERRMKMIVKAYTIIAVISALVGTLAYLGILPGGEIFTRYGRAKAFFQDPNVFGPFLILPAMYALQQMLVGDRRKMLVPGLIVGILVVGVFASFSRAAWGHAVFSSAIVFGLVFLLEAGARVKVRMMIQVLVGLALLLAGFAALISIPAVEKMLATRTQSQDYDSGETGRFGRQGYAWELALANPWGIGPMEFAELRIVEQPHNSYVTFLHHYGWGGGFFYYLLIVLTLWRCGAGLLRAGPHRLLLIPLVATFVPLAGEAAIIDTDHWRHYFLIVGLIWGVTAFKQGVTGTGKQKGPALRPALN